MKTINQRSEVRDQRSDGWTRAVASHWLREFPAVLRPPSSVLCLLISVICPLSSGLGDSLAPGGGGTPTSITNGGATVSTNSDGTISVSPVSGGSVSVVNGPTYLPDKIDFTTQASPVVSGAGHASLNYNGTKLQVSKDGAAFSDLVSFTNISGTDPGPSGSNSTITALTGLTAQSTLTLAPTANTAAIGWLLTDTTAATSGNQQYSPYIYQTGQGWKTTATAASQSVTFRSGVVPVQGTSAPTGTYIIESSINGGAFGSAFAFDTNGRFGSSASSFDIGQAVVGSTISSSWRLNNSTGSIGPLSPTFTLGDSTLPWNYVVAGRQVVNKTSNYTVVTGERGAFYTNAGAAGSVNFTLPTAAANLVYNFYVDAAQTVTITAGSSTTIQLAGSTSASAGNITSSTVGNCITLVAISTTKWVAQSHEGTWTVN